MSAGRQETRGLAREVAGSARVIAFGTSIVAPAVSVVTLLVVMVAYAGFASPLVMLITFVASCLILRGRMAAPGPAGRLRYRATGPSGLP